MSSETPSTPPPPNSPTPALPDRLSTRLEDDASAEQIAAATAAIWQEIDAALSPVVGPRGVAALGQRSLHLAIAAHPWLSAGLTRGSVAFDPALLWPLLARRSREEAAAAGSGFLTTFHGLLSGLIGPALTERLLRNAWGPASPRTP